MCTRRQLWQENRRRLTKCCRHCTAVTLYTVSQKNCAIQRFLFNIYKRFFIFVRFLTFLTFFIHIWTFFTSMIDIVRTSGINDLGSSSVIGRQMICCCNSWRRSKFLSHFIFDSRFSAIIIQHQSTYSTATQSDGKFVN